MADKTSVIIIHETVLQSLARDAGTVAVFVALIGIGWFIGSTAMQWVGAIIAFIALWQRAAGSVQRLTIGEARQKLDTLERETASA